MFDKIIEIGRTIGKIIFNRYVLIAAAVVLLAVILVKVYRKMKLRALSRMEYQRYFSTDGMFAGEECTLTEIIRNPTLFPLFFVEMDFFAPSGLTVDGVKCSEFTKSTSIFNIPPYATVYKVHTVRSDKRDRYRLQSAGVTYCQNEFVYDVPIELYVYPNRYNADVDLSDKIKQSGAAIANRKNIEDPFFFSGIRRYVAGDPMRQVNFKASVRSFSGGQRQLMCNFYESSRNYDTMIYLDLTDYFETDGFAKYSEMLESGLRCACYLFCQAHASHGRVGFCTNSATENSRYVEIPCSTGSMHTKRILECFAGISPYAKHDHSMRSLLQGAIELPPDTDIYLITSHVDEKNAELIRMLERAGKQVSVIGLEAESL